MSRAPVSAARVSMWAINFLYSHFCGIEVLADEAVDILRVSARQSARRAGSICGKPGELSCALSSKPGSELNLRSARILEAPLEAFKFGTCRRWPVLGAVWPTGGQFCRSTIEGLYEVAGGLID